MESKCLVSSYVLLCLIMRQPCYHIFNYCTSRIKKEYMKTTDSIIMLPTLQRKANQQGIEKLFNPVTMILYSRQIIIKK